ncbi:MAG: hypothetical protein AB1665_04075 [Candidatus Thermoplasmatota archaeon]
MGIELLRKLARRGSMFTLDEVAGTERVDRSVLRVLLSRLEHKGYIGRIERGKYVILPLGAEKGSFAIHEFIPASVLVKPYAIGYWSALHHYGMTEQPSRTVFVQTTTRKGNYRKEVFGLPYWLVRVNGRKFFGMRREWVEDMEIRITDREKTILDCLDQPRYCGGVVEVAKALGNERTERALNLKRLSGYAARYGNSGVVRRLGYLCGRAGLDIRLPEPRANSYLYLDPTMPKRGHTDPKWRLFVNLDDRMLGALE